MENNKTTYKFVEEIGLNERPFWYTVANDRYVNGSLSYNQEEAKSYYENIIKHGKARIKVLEEYVKED